MMSPAPRGAHLGDERGGGAVCESLALVVDRGRGDIRLDQFDPAPVHDTMIVRSRDNDGPAEMIGDTDAHASSP